MDNQEKMTCPTVVQGNYSQGSDIFRLSSRGKQCMSMSFTFLVFCHAQNSCTITKNDLDSVLVAGDNLYHEIVKEHSFLLANDLQTMSSLKGTISLVLCKIHIMEIWQKRICFIQRWVFL